MNSKFRAYLPLLTILWISIVISLYYVYHKPLTPELALSLVKSVGSFGVAFLLLSLAGGLGSRIYQTEDSDSLSRITIQAALGIGILAILILGVGITIGFRSIVMWILLIVGLILFWKNIKGWWLDWRGLSTVWRGSDSFERWIASGVLLILLSTLFFALAPPLKFDSLVYHLTLPQAYIDGGRFEYIPWLMYWGMPQTAEMLYTWAMSLAGVQAAVAFSWMTGVITLAGLLGFLSRYFGERFAWVGVASLLAGFSTATSLSWGYVGWLTMLLGFVILVQTFRWLNTQRQHDLIFVGILNGILLGTKYTAGILPVALLIVITLNYRRKPFRELITALLSFSLPALIIFSPWLIKNLIATGNPVYPLLFSAGAMDELRVQLYQSMTIWGDWREFFLLPLRATYLGVEGGRGYSASIGPLLLTLGALAWANRKQNTEHQGIILHVATILTVTSLLIWAVAGRVSGLLIQTRLYFALFPALAILAALGFQSLGRWQIPKVRLSRIVGVLILVVFGFNVFQVVVETIQGGSTATLVSAQTEAEYLENNLGWFARAMQEIQALPEDASVLMLWETRSYYCAPKCLPDEILDRWFHDVNAFSSNADILDSWRGQGISHVLFYNAGADFIRERDIRISAEYWAALDDFLAGLPEPENLGGVYSLYELSGP